MISWPRALATQSGPLDSDFHHPLQLLSQGHIRHVLFFLAAANHVVLHGWQPEKDFMSETLWEGVDQGAASLLECWGATTRFYKLLRVVSHRSKAMGTSLSSVAGTGWCILFRS